MKNDNNNNTLVLPSQKEAANGRFEIFQKLPEL